MALFGIAPEQMKPAALVLNVFVAAIGSVKYIRAGCFSWPVFWPLALASVPLAFVGGWMTLPATFYKPLVGVVLLYAAWRLWRSAKTESNAIVALPRVVQLGAGGLIGFLSGLTGVGGGIFLSPLLLLGRWAHTRQVLGISVAFILVNSIAGLLGLGLHKPVLPEAIGGWTLAAVVGGFIGAELGSRRLPGVTIRRLLALVLVIAGGKMILTV